jgi:hypothetical protein
MHDEKKEYACENVLMDTCMTGFCLLRAASKILVPVAIHQVVELVEVVEAAVVSRCTFACDYL